MSESFRALRIHRVDGRSEARLEALGAAALGPGDVLIRVRYSGINYKDALAATGAGAVLRRFPLIGGIDLAGEVVESTDACFAAGTQVLVCGSGLGETHDGGFSELARVPAEWIVAIPPGLDCRAAMGIGTAGLTAALALTRLERNGQTPDLGPILVSGATGGVGSFAIDLLAARGYEVVALTGKRGAWEYLRRLGARRMLDRNALDANDKPLASAEWGGGVDTLGGYVLDWMLRRTRPNGNVASIGLAAGAALETTVLPFILRGVSLLGVNSVFLPADERAALWQRLASEWRPRHLASIVTREVTLEGLVAQFAAMLSGGSVGRTIVRINGES
jgi:acrylyl-CoA reductase (NADPH)